MKAMASATLALLCSGLAAQWQQLEDFPGTPRDDAASFAIDGVIHVGTGMEVGWGLTNDWYAFDTNTEQWSTIASMPCSQRQYCTGFSTGSTGYVFGGLDVNGPLNELWSYDPSTDQWQQRSSLPGAGRYACVATCVNNGCYVATGMRANGSPTNEFWKYDPSNDEWTQLAPVPGPPRHRAAATDDGGGLLLVGGADSAFHALRDVWSYPVWFETGQWYPRDSLPAPRYGASGGGSYGPFVVAGASDASNFHEDLWEYDDDSWSALADFPGGPRRGGVAASLFAASPSANLYYGLGLGPASERMRDWWRYDHVTSVPALHTDATTTLSPVPTDGMLHVRLSLPISQATWSVRDALGRTVTQGTLTGTSVHLDLSLLPNGSYWLMIAGDHCRSTDRFTVVQ